MKSWKIEGVNLENTPEVQERNGKKRDDFNR